MEPDVVEIAPPIASASRTRKPRKAVVPELIDVEEYEIRNVDKKNKGKAIQVSSFTFNNKNTESHPPHGSSQPLDLESYQNPIYYASTQFASGVMEVDDYTMFHTAAVDSKNVSADVGVMSSNSSSKGGRNGLRSQSVKPNGDQSLATPPIPQQWGFFPGSVLPQNNQPNYLSPNAFAVLQNQTPDVVMAADPSLYHSKYDASASSSRPIAAEVVSSAPASPNVKKIQEDYLRDFKRFDTVDDFSDHHYASKGKTSKQHSKNWVKKIQADWKILENDLPETIFVRASESRMDLMRAVIIGPEGTPYHDGLYFFDIQFPDTYPSVPPKVHYHSGGLRINPNLYACGKVCLSLLGTWSGNAMEKWIPKESTMLQLLVSIQALILNQKPYFNEPGYERSKGTTSGESHSKAYSENVFILSLRTMVYNMRRPPKHFEEFVGSHFFLRAHDIVKACNAYKDGVPLGSMIKGGVQDVEESSSSQSGSKKFRTDVANFMKTVVEEFVKVGVKELEEKPKPAPELNANTEINKANRKRSRASSIFEFIANIGRCVFPSQ